jgi:hypothetical protein
MNDWPLGYLQRWILKSEIQTVGWVFIRSSSRCRKKSPVSSPAPQVLGPCHGGPASPIPVELEPPLPPVQEEKGAKEPRRAESSSSWSRDGSVFDASATSDTGGEGAEEPSWSRVELKLEPLPLCLRRQWWELFGGAG